MAVGAFNGNDMMKRANQRAKKWRKKKNQR